MSRQQFARLYNEYTKLYTEKNHEGCLEKFTQVDLKSNYAKNIEQVLFMLRSVGDKCLKMSKTKYNISIANGWKDVFFAASRGSNYETLFPALKAYTGNLEMNTMIIAGLPPSIFNVTEWLQELKKYFFEVLNNTNIVDDSQTNKRKEITLKFTEMLLIIVYAEAKQAKWKFNESQDFVKMCQQFKLFRNDEISKQYNSFFKLLDELLVALSAKADDEKFGTAMEKFRTHLSSLISDDVRATLIQDSYVTSAKILKAYTPRFLEIISSKNVTGCFKLIAEIATTGIRVKSDKPFCTDCDGIGNHCVHEMATLAMEMYTKLIEKGVDDENIKQFSSIIKNNFYAISKLKCAKALNTQWESVSKFRELLTKCETKEKAKFMIPVIKSLLQRYNQFKLMDKINNNFDQVFILKHLFDLVNATDQFDEVVNVAYLFMAFHSSVPNHLNKNFELIGWHLAKKQKENKATITPIDHFKSKNKESLYGLKLPDSFDINKLSLEFLKIGFKYNIMAVELSNKIVHHLIMNASQKDPNALQFVLSVQTMSFDKITSERVDKIVNSLHTQSKNDLSIALQIAAIKYLRFNFECSQLQEKYSSLSISDSLTEAKLTLDNSIFREITLDYEKGHIETLRYVKDKFIGFTEFYLSKTDEERKKFESEKQLLLRELKVVANQFVVRGFTEDGLEIYMALFKLARAIKDEFGLIDACSYFAENCVDFKQKYKTKDLKAIIEECSAASVGKLKEFNDLTQRKQIQICFCILNLAIYYYEDGGDHKNEINVILSFVFKLIGGTSDKEMKSTMDALIGPMEFNGKPTNETKKLSEAIRIKFYSVLFTIITKYGGPSAFHPSKFIQFIMNHIKTYLNVYYDSSATVPILLYNMIPQMVLWLEGNYTTNVESPALMVTMLKFSSKSGYAQRTVNLLLVMMQMELMNEKVASCKLKFKALENIMISEASNGSAFKKLENAMITVDEQGRLCEPIRKQAAVKSPMKCLSPAQTIGRRTTQSSRYLVKHTKGCDCGICFCPQNKFLMFCAAVSYARLVYLNDDEFDEHHKRTVFNELLVYWKKYKAEKIWPKTDSYYLVCARMLLHDGHFKWKFDKDYTKAIEQLRRALEGLKKVQRGAEIMKHNIQDQVESMEATIPMLKMSRDEKYAAVNYISRNKNFIDSDDEPKKNSKPVKKSAAAAKIQLATKSTPKPPVKLLDMINKDPPQTPSNFRIYNEGGSLNTPIVKRSTRQKDKIEETPVRKVPAEALKTSERPKRVPKPNPAPIDLTAKLPPPRKVNRRSPTPMIQIDLSTPSESSNGYK